MSFFHFYNIQKSLPSKNPYPPHESNFEFLQHLKILTLPSKEYFIITAFKSLAHHMKGILHYYSFQKYLFSTWQEFCIITALQKWERAYPSRGKQNVRARPSRNLRNLPGSRPGPFLCRDVIRRSLVTSSLMGNMRSSLPRINKGLQSSPTSL